MRTPKIVPNFVHVAINPSNYEISIMQLAIKL